MCNKMISQRSAILEINDCMFTLLTNTATNKYDAITVTFVYYNNYIAQL